MRNRAVSGDRTQTNLRVNAARIDWTQYLVRGGPLPAWEQGSHETVTPVQQRWDARWNGAVFPHVLHDGYRRSMQMGHAECTPRCRPLTLSAARRVPAVDPRSEIESSGSQERPHLEAVHILEGTKLRNAQFQNRGSRHNPRNMPLKNDLRNLPHGKSRDRNPAAGTRRSCESTLDLDHQPRYPHSVNLLEIALGQVEHIRQDSRRVLFAAASCRRTRGLSGYWDQRNNKKVRMACGGRHRTLCLHTGKRSDDGAEGRSRDGRALHQGHIATKGRGAQFFRPVGRVLSRRLERDGSSKSLGSKTRTAFPVEFATLPKFRLVLWRVADDWRIRWKCLSPDGSDRWQRKTHPGLWMD